MRLIYYTAFGHRISSTIPLPELRTAPPGPVRWRFSVVDHLPEPENIQLLGEQPIYGDVSARLFQHAAGHRITVDDTGSYDLVNDNQDINWLPNADPWWDFGRSHLIGRVMATLLQLSGTVTLHASAVEMADGVVGFLAPKHFGKSTLAMRLFQAGARFVTDDSLPISSEAPVFALPGIQSLRVRADDPNTERLLGATQLAEPGRDGKIVLPPLPEDQTLNGPARVSALYLLWPRDPAGTTEPAERVRVQGAPAAIQLVGQVKIAAMLGGAFAQPLLEGVAAIATTVPVYELAVVRDLDRLPGVIEQLVSWHGLP